MRISVNLASRPFVELRPFFARLRLVMGLLVLVAIGIGIWLHSENVKLQAADAQMQDLQNRTQAARGEKLRNEARMRQPVNAAVLERAHFLNALFLRKSFSWTAVMMDLETVLPTGVQVTSIEPQITADGDVIIRLRVAGDRDRAVQLVRNLEHSQRFLTPRISGESAQTKDAGTQGSGNRGGQGAAAAVPGGVEFEILANYNPVPASEPYKAGKPSRHAETGEGALRRSARSLAPANVRYPRDGVVLKPYSASRPAPGIPLNSNAQTPKAMGGPR